MDNRAGEMEVFAAAVDLGNFSAAGRRLGLSPSAVSKLVTRLEERLGTRLLVRSTRALQLTPEGDAYLQRARRILAEIEDTERVVAGGAAAAPRGLLRLNVSVGFGVRCVVPLVPDFLKLYPEVQLDLSLSDSIIDLIEERADIAIRTGPLRDSSLTARKVMESPRVIVGAPDYLKHRGIPKTPADLDRHNCLIFNFRSTQTDWPFRDPKSGKAFMKPVGGNLMVNNGLTMRQMALRGVGLVRLARFDVETDIAAGHLVPVLEKFSAGDTVPFHALFVSHDYMAARIRAFLDFLTDWIANNEARVRRRG
ncbi:MAG TPA: LysR family transcriptional regulator [Dongiaceae bacterium]|nr:LysR family transcriptional regulator [Dongiaceae bacterium]